jgi:hypothetical protein
MEDYKTNMMRAADGQVKIDTRYMSVQYRGENKTLEQIQKEAHEKLVALVKKIKESN